MTEYQKKILSQPPSLAINDSRDKVASLSDVGRGIEVLITNLQIQIDDVQQDLSKRFDTFSADIDKLEYNLKLSLSRSSVVNNPRVSDWASVPISGAGTADQEDKDQEDKDHEEIGLTATG
ncbi:hypothetical protein NADFUDRAFT_76437 [Nadsonia fulvescens var. elongata DSM 6958]|uniref:Uncharacterized protein n=1 Tax=Nadsonia fulvescens var. elongata DSM 6958 TaxID=857566 RepID=A0A1E3PT27_9ASCO|nr:hypothetical protein NADFUDRAFT_76437 [Nadsonia fulvescens var. elongata DSM 6958]